MTSKAYTMPQIEEAWKQYQSAHCWRYMKPGGSRAVRMSAPDPASESVIQCKMVKVRTVMDFPRYLEIMSES